MSIKLEDIKYELLCEKSFSIEGQSMLPNEIPGARVLCFKTRKNDERIIKKEKNIINILFLLKGRIEVCSKNNKTIISNPSVYVDYPNIDYSIKTIYKSEFLLIKWELNNDDLRELELKKDLFPFTQAYKDALQYRDPFKSETTISRAIIIHDFIPRFAMGSVEAKGDDLVGQHSHPLLDQFFFSLEDNDADLLIDCRIFNFKRNTLIHIPLGSNHGVIARGNQKMHYLWLDFTPKAQKEDAVAYLNDTHKPTGLKEELK